MQRHAAALEADVRSLQSIDHTADWPAALKQAYNWHFAQCFVRQKIFRNWAADAAAWRLLPERTYLIGATVRLSLKIWMRSLD
ncbi:MAG: hypothetical protein HC840_23925 [Leptolyngbyaceae cyanobacterium RM2_2_4]|nr:hypothetical protein [Leptolyngbyaceae cyanobacterium RM2_2_4]